MYNFPPNMGYGSGFGQANVGTPFLATGTPLRTSMPYSSFQGVPQGNPLDASGRTTSAMPTTFTSAAAAAASLGAQYPHATTAPPVGSTKVRSAFEVLGVGPPARSAVNLDQGERFIQAISGEKRPLPTWNGQPATMRSWLKLLAYWEIESTVPREKWGLRLYQSFPEGSKPRQIADQIGMQELLSAGGYSLVLSSIIAKYRPFLKVAGPAAIDRFLYTGERAKGESFANYIAGKEVARQEVESHLQERLNDNVAGRVLLRPANLSEFQRELLALRDHSQLLTFDQVAAILRPLDRPELRAQAIANMLKHLSSWILKSKARPPCHPRRHGVRSLSPNVGWALSELWQLGKTMAQTILLMLATARQQMVVDQLVKKNNEPELNPPSSSTSSFKGQRKAKDAPINQGLGKPLARSKAQCQVQQGTFRVQPSIGRSALPSEQQGNLVDMHALRFEMAAPQGRPVIYGNHILSSGGEGEEGRPRVPEVPSMELDQAGTWKVRGHGPWSSGAP